KTREGSYYTLEFDVPEGVESLTVSYAYPRVAAGGKPGLNIIDLGLEDERGRFLGWSGSARGEVTVGEFTATPGYLMQPVRPGKWKILVGAYRVRESGAPVEYRIEFRPKGPRWFFGDFHVHSDASDGQHDISTLARMAKRLGLDFLSVTNHNNFSENLSLPAVPGLTLVPGVEWTHYKGHMNFFGVPRPFRNSFIANSEEEMLRVVGEAKEAGAIVSANHPKCNLCPYLWKDESCFSMVEVWNGPMRPVNIAGIAWWAGMLDQGRRLAAVGGSDFHRDRRPVRLGHPVTAVYAASPAASDILAAAAAGRSYATSSVTGVRLNMECEGETFGGAVDGAGPRSITFGAQRLPAGASLRLVGPEGKELARAKRGSRGAASGRAWLEGIAYCYLVASVRLLFLGDWPLAVSNPIYFKK
ncbi:MAG TPA: CehA/McbA family metallohydrolase, partial [Clostridia bacterium]|nr:CehA/McbA family metallohydrolase [Clostridia bacterium]